MSNQFLYRGVSYSMHEKLKGQLTPKEVGIFNYTFHWGERGAKWNSGITWGSSERNAVIRHQLNQEGFPTAGVSTTPHCERALFYVRGRDGSSSGFVYKIDRNLFTKYGVKEYVVASFVKQPSIPEDDEVILVASDGGVLPPDIVVEIIEVDG
jgi:hypothetical protein